MLAQLEAGLIARPSEPIALLHAWEKASRRYAHLGSPSRGFLLPEDLQPIQGVDQDEVESLLHRIRAYPPFDTHGVTLYEVNVSKLITPRSR